jgi:glycosyltransferase involved in cell wall biosynthesis
MRPKKLLYLVANDRYFCSHRLSLALTAKQHGYDVTVITPALGDHQKIIDAGLNFIPLSFKRGGLNPLSELKTIYQIWKIYKRIEPDVVHHVALKPVLYGTIAALMARIPHIVNAIAGLGHIFAAGSWLKLPLRFALRFLLKHKNVKIIVQNPEDAEEIRKLVDCHKNRSFSKPTFLALSSSHSLRGSLDPRIKSEDDTMKKVIKNIVDDKEGSQKKSNIHLILGAGVNLNKFKPKKEPPTPPLKIIHVSRLLWTKGIKELVEAGQILKKQGHDIQIQIVGEPDLENPAVIPAKTLKEWHDQNLIEWLGHRSDIADLYQQSHIACLASYYREGIPKSLIEAAACGKPIITCDMPGCRIIVEDGKNGFLIPPRDPKALAEAICKLLDLTLRQKMSEASRLHAETYFGEEVINAQTLELYHSS